MNLGKLVVGGNNDFTTPGISLAAAAAEELPVDSTRFMQFRGDNVKPSEVGDVWTKLNVCASTRHVGGNGNASRPPGFRNDHGLAEVLSCVEQLVLQISIRQERAEMF